MARKPATVTAGGDLSRKKKPSKRSIALTCDPFIISTFPGRPDPKTRQAIRSYVMLGKNKRTKADSLAHKRPAVGSWINGDHDPSCPELQALRKVKDDLDDDTPSNLTLIPDHPSPNKIGSDLALVRFAGEMRPGDLELIFKFFTVIKREMYPVDFCLAFDPTNSIWFEYLGRDAAYVHSILFSAGAYFDHLSGHEFSPSSLRHLAKTLELLRSTLEQESGAVSESTISVVVGLAGVAECLGDPDEAVRHLRGLHRMIQMRGGIGSLSRNSQLQIKSCRADLGVSIATGRKPLFFADGISWRSYLAPDGTAARRTEIHDVLAAPDQRLVNVWVDMKEFCRAANIAFVTGCKLDPELFQEVMTSVQYRLLHLDFQESTGDRPGWQEALRLSMLAFATTVFLKIRGVDIRYQNLAVRLKAAILSLDKPEDKARREMRLWIEVVAGIVLSQGPEGSGLKDCLAGVDLKSWNEARVVLKDQLWIDCLHDKPGEAMYHYMSQSCKG